MSSESKIMTGREFLLRQQRKAPLITQVPLFDRLEEGGLPRGSLIELSGRGSTGRFTMALATLSAATRMGESTAMIDLGDHLDPQGACAAGADLSRLLWVRPSTIKEAITAAEMILAAGFSFVVLDLSGKTPRRLSDGICIRLSRAARDQSAVMMVSASVPLMGSAADLIIQIEHSEPVWRSRKKGPTLLRGLSVDLTLKRRKGGRGEISGQLFLPYERNLPDVDEDRLSLGS